jgi:hypothetical protein
MSQRRRVHKWQRAKTGVIVLILPAIYLPHGFDLQLFVNVQSATPSRAGIIAVSQPTHKIENHRGAGQQHIPRLPRTPFRRRNRGRDGETPESQPRKAG